MSIRTAAVTPDNWSDFEDLFGPTGQQGGCWCMWTRQTSRQFDERKGEPNRQAIRELVATGPPPGLLAYIEDTPVGWVAVGPRESFSRLGRSPVTKPVDDTPVWSITCFVIDRTYRRRGVATALLDAAVRYAAESGAEAVEGYPVEERVATRCPTSMRGWAWRRCSRRRGSSRSPDVARPGPSTASGFEISRRSSS